MPSNCQVHAARMGKVRQGLQAARILPADIVAIDNAFDRLSAADAQVVALRTEFSVSTRAKAAESLFGSGNAEERRQMARASMFVDDLTTLSAGLSLPPKISDDDFERVWRGNGLALQATLGELVKRLIHPPAPSLPAVVGATVVKIPQLPVPKVPVSPAVLKLISAAERRDIERVVGLRVKQLERAAERRPEAPSGPVLAAWSNAKTELIKCFAVQVNKSMSQITSMQVAATGAYTEFEKFVRDAAAELQFKIDLVKSIFSALKEAPFPISMVGKVGEAICNVMHVDTEVAQTRKLAGGQYFNTDVPLLARATAKYEEFSGKATELTRFGVSTATLPSGTSVHDALDAAKVRSVELLNNVFCDVVKNAYGEDPREMQDKCFAFANEARAQIMPNAPHELVGPMIVNKINELFHVTKSSIDAARSLPLITSDQLQPFIELQLYAQYMAALAPGDDFDVTVPDALIKRLEGPPFSLVKRKTGSGQTAQIYASKKLPWDAHVRHVGALIVFFRWYAKEVNPFEIAVGRTSTQAVRQAMESTIGEIGRAIAANVVTRRLRHDTADWAQVRAAIRI